MILKNISDTDFSFEGIEIKVGEYSEELDLLVAQRLLALYWGIILIPKEEEVMIEEENKKEEDKESKTEHKDATKDAFICEVCKKEFSSKKGLTMHNNVAHKK